jgi:hypothetical protein
MKWIIIWMNERVMITYDALWRSSMCLCFVGYELSWKILLATDRYFRFYSLYNNNNNVGVRYCFCSFFFLNLVHSLDLINTIFRSILLHNYFIINICWDILYPLIICMYEFVCLIYKRRHNNIKQTSTT